MKPEVTSSFAIGIGINTFDKIIFGIAVISMAIIGITVIGTRSYAALRAADLGWIVGPGYNLGGYILGCSQCLALCHCWDGPN